MPSSLWVVLIVLHVSVVTAVALVATSLGVGYAIGVNSAKSASAKSGSKPDTAAPALNDPPVEEDSEDEGDVADGDLSAIKPGFTEPCKLVRSPSLAVSSPRIYCIQVLVVRTDLNMTPGKIAAQ